MSFGPTQVCLMTNLPYKVYFSCQNSTFCDVKVWPDPDPYWFGFLDPDSGSDPHWGKKLDPDTHWNQCGSETLVQRISLGGNLTNVLMSCLTDVYLNEAVSQEFERKFNIGKLHLELAWIFLMEEQNLKQKISWHYPQKGWFSLFEFRKFMLD